MFGFQASGSLSPSACLPSCRYGGGGGGVCYVYIYRDSKKREETQKKNRWSRETELKNTEKHRPSWFFLVSTFVAVRHLAHLSFAIYRCYIRYPMPQAVPETLDGSRARHVRGGRSVYVCQHDVRKESPSSGMSYRDKKNHELNLDFLVVLVASAR